MKMRYALFTIIILLLFFRFHPEQIHFEKTKNTDSMSLYQTDEEEVLKWNPQLDEFSPKDTVQVQKILAQDFHVAPSDSSFQKMTKISAGLIRVMRGLPGNPSDDVFQLSPLELYDHCKKRNIAVYCTQYTLLYTFFCKMAGLTVRPIESFGANDRHNTYECFLPEENRWVWSDLLNNIIYLEDEQGKLNLLQTLSYIHQHNMIDVNVIGLNDTFKRSIRLGKSVEAPLEFNFDSTCVFHYYHETNLSKVYSGQERLLRFLGNKTWYERYALKPKSNTWFYLKYALFLAFMISFGYVILYLLRFFLPMKNNFEKK